MKDSCAATLALLEKYFDHEVSDEERSGIETHIGDCSACQDRLKAMEGLRNLLKSPVDEVDQKEDFSRVWLRIEREIQQEETPAWGESLRRWIDLPSILRKRVWVPAAAVIVAIFLALAPSALKNFPSSSDTSVVEYVESQNYNVMVYEAEKGNVTVIWLFEGPEKEGLSPS